MNFIYLFGKELLLLGKSSTSTQEIVLIVEEIKEIWTNKFNAEENEEEKQSYEFMLQALLHRKIHTFDWPYVALGSFLAVHGLEEY